MELDYKSLAYKIFCWSFFALCGFLFFKYLFVYLFPFVISWAVGYAVYPIAIKMSKRTKISRRVCSFVIVFVILVLVLSVLFLICNRLVYEIQNLFDYLSENGDKIGEYVEKVFNFINGITNRIPILSDLQNTEIAEKIEGNINSIIESIWGSLLESLGSAVPDFAGHIVTALPNILFVSLLSVIASFYFALDVDVIHLKIKKYIPSAIKKQLGVFKKALKGGFVRFLKAYCIIFSITFLELFFGFLILGIDYAFVLALVVALLDIMPVLGTGIVLAPWGVALIVTGNYFLGAGILILLIAITVVRQVIEPKIIGDSFGIHPLVGLITVYLGLRLFGIVGMIMLPIIAMIVFSGRREGEGG